MMQQSNLTFIQMTKSITKTPERPLMALLLLLGVVPMLVVAAPPHTGIQGRTTVCSPCGVFPGPFHPSVAPVQTKVTIVSTQTGRKVSRVTSDANGYFKISLPRGTYVLLAEPLPWPSDSELVCALLAAPVEVAVETKNFSVVSISYAPVCEPAQ